MNAKKKRVLIIEDDDALRSILADALRAEGIDVVEAKDGERGLMEAEQCMPDLILLDILMPRMDGRTTFRLLRERPKFSAVPVSFLTNLSDMEYIAMAAEKENTDYILKSDWGIDEIIAHVKRRMEIA